MGRGCCHHSTPEGPCMRRCGREARAQEVCMRRLRDSAPGAAGSRLSHTVPHFLQSGAAQQRRGLQTCCLLALRLCEIGRACLALLWSASSNGTHPQSVQPTTCAVLRRHRTPKPWQTVHSKALAAMATMSGSASTHWTCTAFVPGGWRGCEAGPQGAWHNATALAQVCTGCMRVCRALLSDLCAVMLHHCALHIALLGCV